MDIDSPIHSNLPISPKPTYSTIIQNPKHTLNLQPDILPLATQPFYATIVQEPSDSPAYQTSNNPTNQPKAHTKLNPTFN